MPFDLVADILGDDTDFYLMFKNRLQQYVETNQEDLLELSCFRQDEPLLEEELNRLFKGSVSLLSVFVANEIFTDLYASYKQGDSTLKGRADLERLVRLTYIKYAEFLRLKVRTFYKNLSRLQSDFELKKRKTQKIKRVPLLQEPIKITLDIRFAIIKRANGKCEGCLSSILDDPIEVYQIKERGHIKLVAYCEKCKERNNDIILESL